MKNYIYSRLILSGLTDLFNICASVIWSYLIRCMAKWQACPNVFFFWSGPETWPSNGTVGRFTYSKNKNEIHISSRGYSFWATFGLKHHKNFAAQMIRIFTMLKIKYQKIQILMNFYKYDPSRDWMCRILREYFSFCFSDGRRYRKPFFIKFIKLKYFHNFRDESVSSSLAGYSHFTYVTYTRQF